MMRIRGKYISDVTAEDIKNLIENSVSESSELEYKSSLPDFNKNLLKLKFIAEVSAFANKSGGVIIYGIVDKVDENGKNTGIADEIVSVGDINEDVIGLQIDNILADTLQPSLKSVKSRLLRIDDKNVFILGIAKSYLSPHMISFEKNGKFYTRTNSGKQIMDVNEIRSAFMASSLLNENIESFWKSRINLLENKHILQQVNLDRYMIIHLMPLNQNQYHIDLKSHEEVCKKYLNAIIQDCRFTYNIDGLLACPIQGKWDMYAQLFRSGSIELFLPLPAKHINNVHFVGETISGKILQARIFFVVKKYIEWSTNVDIQYPIYMNLYLGGVGGMYIGNEDSMSMLHLDQDHVDARHFDRDPMFIPGPILDHSEIDLAEEMQLFFDILWQAGGWSSRPIPLPTPQEP